MKIIALIILGILGIILLLFVAFGMYRTRKSERSPDHAVFLGGQVPAVLPDGLYSGSANGYSGSWKGKNFIAPESRGINLFDVNGIRKEKYPFATRVAPGIRDPNVRVIKIDYNIPGNPLWLRSILDEIVETESGTYLGKVHIRLLPGHPFTMGYFRLEKKQ